MVSWHSVWCLPALTEVLQSLTSNDTVYNNFKNIELIFEQGQHQKFESEKVKRYISKLTKSIRNATKLFDIKFTKKTYVAPPRRSILKPISFRKCQPDEILPKFEKVLSKKVKELGWNFLHLSNITSNLHSLDGVHYGFNVYKTFWTYYFGL